MRLFVAVDLDAAARAAIAAEQARIAAAIRDVGSPATWVKPDRMHLTLVFLGDIETLRVPAIVESMGRPIDAPPFELVLEHVGTFPPRGAPRVIWLGVGDGARHLVDLQEEIARRIRALHVKLESRVFHPHLTLGRWKTSRFSDRRKVLAAVEPGPIARLIVDGATLYHSRLSSPGPAYTPLARATLS